MIELTNELKARFFAQYWGQEVLRFTHPNLLDDIWRVNELEDDLAGRYGYLELKPLSSITDEDAAEVARLMGRFGLYVYLINQGRGFINSAGIPFRLPIKVYQYLQSKGYALPFMDISVTTFIEAGWVKLKGGDL